MSMELSPMFERLVEALQALTRDHLLYFRVQMGRLIATELYGGDVATMRAQLARRDGVLHAFVAAQAKRLDDLGLTEEQLRLSLHAWAVVQLLPATVVERLSYTHVIELAKVGDDDTRKLLADATVDNAWSRRELRHAIDGVRAGQWPDADPSVPGLQPGPVIDAAGSAPEPLAPGRVVTQLEKAAHGLEGTATRWRGVDVRKLAPAQKLRVRSAMERLKAQIAEIEGGLD